MNLLLVTPDQDWAETLEMELGPQGFRFSSHSSAEAALNELKQRPNEYFDAVVLSAFPVPGRPEIEALADAIVTINQFRSKCNHRIPLLLCSRSNDPRLIQMLPSSGEALISVISDDTPSAVAAAVSGAVAARTAPVCAAVELEIRVNQVRVRVEVGGRTIIEYPHDWGQRLKLQRLEAKFRHWRPWWEDGTGLSHSQRHGNGLLVYGLCSTTLSPATSLILS
jgi:hypothetical protein